MPDVRRIWYRTSTGTLRSFTPADCQEIIDHPPEAESQRYAVICCLKDGTRVGMTYFPTPAGQAFEIPGASVIPAPAPAPAPPRPSGDAGASAVPDPAMFRAYLAATGGIRQQAIAEELGVSQATVCRYIQRVRAWISAGNRLPGLDELPPASRPRTIPVDPHQMSRWTQEDD